MWPFRSRLDLIARADAAALAGLMGDAALDYARRHAQAVQGGRDDGMWPDGHWSRVRREVRVVLDWPREDQGAVRDTDMRQDVRSARLLNSGRCRV